MQVVKHSVVPVYDPRPAEWSSNLWFASARCGSAARPLLLTPEVLDCQCVGPGIGDWGCQSRSLPCSANSRALACSEIPLFAIAWWRRVDLAHRWLGRVRWLGDDGVHARTTGSQRRFRKDRSSPADDSYCLLEFEDVAARNPSWCQSSASAGVSQWVCVSLQSPLLSNDGIQLSSWLGCQRKGSYIRNALHRQMDPPKSLIGNQPDRHGLTDTARSFPSIGN